MSLINERIKKQLAFCINHQKKISFLVGAGISAASGIPTFRTDDGFWVHGSKNYTPQELGTKRYFDIASHEVLKFHLYRKSITTFAEPNESHFLLRDIEELLGDQFALISQNVDSLHKKAGNTDARTFLIHGDHDFMRCGDACTDAIYPFPEAINLENRKRDQLTAEETALLKCPNCGEDMRPHVLWFDEYYNEKYFKKDTVLRISKQTGILFVIGTSGETNLPQVITKNVLARSGMVVEVNIAPSFFSELLEDKANGMVLNTKSTPFLNDLKELIESI